MLTAICLLALSAPGAGLEAISSAELCGDCHRAIHETWKASRHAHAMDSRLFQDVLHWTEADLGAAARRTCLGCHAPLALEIGDLSLQKKVSWEGVTCDYCHSVREVTMAAPNPKAKLKFDRMKTGPWKEADPGKHGAIFSEVHTSSEICAPCHEYRNALGFPVLTTFSEWKASRYAKEGRPCQSCHMPRVEHGGAARLVGATLLGAERHRQCEFCHAASAAGDVVEQRARRSSAAKSNLRDMVNLHEMKGSHSIEQLTSAIKAQLEAAREGNKLKVTVAVANVAAGHYVPTGSPLRQLVLEIRADTGGGKHFREERVYRRTVVDQQAKPVEREHIAFVKGVTAISDTRLAPDEKRSETFLFDVPPGDQTEIKAIFWYYYSPLATTESHKRVTFLTLSRLVQ